MKTLLWGLGLLLLVPFIVICYYIFPQADDWCFALPYRSMQDWLYRFYTAQNGRYFNAFMVKLPVYDLWIYRVIPIIGFIFITLSFKSLLKAFATTFQIELEKSQLYLAAFITFMVLVLGLPAQAQFFYWYAAFTAYAFSVGLNNFIVARLLYISYTQESVLKHTVVAAILIFMAIGSHEISMALVDFSLFLFFVRILLYDRGKLKIAVLLNALGVLFSLMVVLAPGSAHRKGDRVSNIHANFEGALREALFCIPEYLTNLSLIFVGLSFMLYFLYQTSKKKEEISIAFSPIVVFVVSYLYLLIPHFIVYYALGINANIGPLKGRVANFLFALYLMLFLFNMINLGCHLGRQLDLTATAKDLLRKLGLLFITLAVIGGYSSSNYQETVRVLVQGDANAYKQNMLQLIADMRKDKYKGKKIYIEPFDKPEIFITGRFTGNPYAWENNCFVNAARTLYKTKAKYLQERSKGYLTIKHATLEVTKVREDSSKIIKEGLTMKGRNTCKDVIRSSLDSAKIAGAAQLRVSLEYKNVGQGRNALFLVMNNKKNAFPKKWEGTPITRELADTPQHQWRRVVFTYEVPSEIAPSELIHCYLWISKNRAAYHVRNLEAELVAKEDLSQRID